MANVIAIESPSGLGKTTLIKALHAHYKSLGKKVRIFDIDKTKYSKVLLSIQKKYPKDSLISTLIFWTLRLMLDREIKKTIEKNNVDLVLLDRTFYSAIVTDQVLVGVPLFVLNWISKFIKVKADITFFLNGNLGLSLCRQKDSETLQNSIKAEQIFKCYKKLAKRKKWIHVDASQKPKEVSMFCIEKISKLLRC